MPALNPKQRFEITFLTQLSAECCGPIDRGDNPAWITGVFACYAMAENIRPEDFDAAEREEYPHAYCAAEAAAPRPGNRALPVAPKWGHGSDVVMGAEKAYQQLKLEHPN